MQSRKADNKAEGTAGQKAVSHNVNLENKRVKEVTDAILYDLLPNAIASATNETEEACQELTPDLCQEVAAVALVAACLLNAPPNFLEFLLCIPWMHLGELFPRSDTDAGDLPQTALGEAERQQLASLPVQSVHLDCLIDFLYRPSAQRKMQFVDSLPVQLRILAESPPVNLQQAEARPTTRSAVAALLDGATPLHAAALRGNPAQIDHLLFCKADPMACTAAGDLPFELVPSCDCSISTGTNGKKAAACQCMGRREAEVWQCRSKLARGLIVRRCLTHFAGGFKAWAYVLFVSLACMLGFWSAVPVMQRPGLQDHEQKRAHSRRAELAAQARALMKRMRVDISQGLQYLTAAKQRTGNSTSSADLDPGDTRRKAKSPSKRATGSKHSDTAPSIQQPGRDRGAQHKRCTNADSAFDCFSRALKALQALGSHGNVKCLHTFGDSNVGSSATESGVTITEDEQADLYCCWAEAAFLRFRDCLCIACTTTATQAIRMAYFHTARLFATTEKKRARSPDLPKLVGVRLARVLHTQICLLVDTQDQHTATRSTVQQCQQCLQEWDRMKALGLVSAAGLVGSHQAQRLTALARTAGADLTLVEALQGFPLDPAETLANALPGIFVDVSGRIFLSRQVEKDTAQQLATALAVAEGASQDLLQRASSAADNAEAEVRAGETLQDIMTGKLDITPGAAVDTLSQAIQTAQHFPNLEAAVQAGQQLLERWTTRNEAVAQLDAAIDEVSGPIPSQSLPRQGHEGPSVADHDAFWAEWALRIQTLERGIGQARGQGISVSKAKRVLKELQSQADAAEAASKLQAVLQRKPCKASILKAEVAKAEAASSAASGGVSGLSVGSDMLTPLIHRAKQHLDVERARGSLHKALATAQTDPDLPQLEAAIQAARKAGIQDGLKEASRHANELRSKLDKATQARTELQTAVEALLKHNRPEDAAQVEEAITSGQECGSALDDDVAVAKQALQRWQLVTSTEVKLARAVSEGNSILGLSRAIQEATACGLKVADAKRVLKLMQSLEAAQTSTTSDGTTPHRTLKARLEAAEQGGVSASFLEPARFQLRKLLMTDVKKVIEAALRTRPGRRAALKTGAVRDALDQAETMLETGLGPDAQPFMSSAQNWRALHVRAAQQTAAAGDKANGKLAGGDVLSIPDAPAVKRMLGEAYRFLEEEAEELARLNEEHAAEVKLKREQQIEREKAAKEKAEKDRAERERAEREKAERRRIFREEQMAAAKENELTADSTHNKVAQERMLPGNSAWGQAQPPSHHAPVQQPLQQNGLHFQQQHQQQSQEQNASPLTSFANGPVAQAQQQPQPTAMPDFGSVESQWLQAVRLAAPSNGQKQQQHSDYGSQAEPNVWINDQPSAQGSVQVPDAYDGYEASISERHSDTTSETTLPESILHKPQGRPFANSPSMRSSAASTDDILSPAAAHRLMTHSFPGPSNSTDDVLSPAVPHRLMTHSFHGTSNGTDDALSPAGAYHLMTHTFPGSSSGPAEMHSPAVAHRITSNGVHGSNSGSAGLQFELHSAFSGSTGADQADSGGGPLARHAGLQAGSGQVLQSGNAVAEPHPRTWSPELGTERSSSSFSSSVAGGTKLTYADMGGAGWGMEATHRPTFAAPAPAFQSPSGTAPAPAFPSVGSTASGPEFGPLGAGWPAQQQRATSPGAWPASPNLPSHLDQRPQSAEPVRPRSAGAIRGHLHVPVDAHMAALGFMADDASPAPGFNTNAPEYVPLSRHGSLGDEATPLDGRMPRTLRVQRPCRYYLQGYCREGGKCRFAHNRDPSNMSLPLEAPAFSAAPVASSPFSLLAASRDLPTSFGPSMRSLTDPGAYPNQPIAPTAPVPQALAEPLLSGTYSSDSVPPNGSFSFGVRPQPDRFRQQEASAALPSSKGLGIALPLSATLPGAVSSQGLSTPRSPNPRGFEGSLPLKQSPFPGVGAGVAGTSPFKFSEAMERKFDGWSVAQQPF